MELELGPTGGRGTGVEKYTGKPAAAKGFGWKVSTPVVSILRILLETHSLIISPSSGAYLYRKDRRKRNSKGFESKKDEKMGRPDLSQDQDTESYSSSAESNIELEDKVVLRLSETLKGFLEYDYVQVKMKSRLVNLPSNVTVITVLENYVKHNAIKYICGTLKRDKLKRRNSQTKHERDHIVDPDKFANNLNICKEVADGLRIYFDFTLKDFLLYEPERKQYEDLFTKELVSGEYKHTPSDRPYFLDYLPQNKPPPMPDIMELGGSITDQQSSDETARRRLRSHRPDDADFSLLFESGLSGSESCQSGILSNQNTAIGDLLKSVLPSNTSLPYRVRHLLQTTLSSWDLLPRDAPVEASMIYGAIHLARLIGEFYYLHLLCQIVVYLNLQNKKQK